MTACDEAKERGGIPDIDLVRARRRIDEIDSHIIELFQERMKTVRDVAECKRRTGKAVFDARREAEKVAAAVEQAADEFKGYMPSLFDMLMEMSKSYQESRLSRESELSRRVRSLRGGERLPHPMRIACQGVEGAYAHEAARRMFPASSDCHRAISFCRSWAEVCDSVVRGEVDFGALPLENSTAGSIGKVYDLLATRGLYICREFTMPIRHCLLANEGVALSDVREVFSHEQALRQCEGYLERMPHAVKATLCANTAMAARDLSESGRMDAAAISSEGCADIYGLRVLARNIQDADDNFTRFVGVSREPHLYETCNRSSFLLELPHEPGSLYRVLSRLVALGVNLLKLESRPIPGRAFDFMFYVDVECVPGDEAFLPMAAQLPHLCERCVYLGSYAEFS